MPDGNNFWRTAASNTWSDWWNTLFGNKTVSTPSRQTTQWQPPPFSSGTISPTPTQSQSAWNTNMPQMYSGHLPQNASISNEVHTVEDITNKLKKRKKDLDFLVGLGYPVDTLQALMSPDLTDAQYTSALSQLYQIMPQIYAAKSESDAANIAHQWKVDQDERQQRTAEAMAQAKASEAYQNAALYASQTEKSRNEASAAQAYERAIAPREAQWARIEQQQADAEQFEKMRKEILDTTAPRDWFVREKARLAINPFAREVQTAGPAEGGTGPTMASTPYPYSSPFPFGFPNEQVNVPTDVKPFLSGQNKGFGAPVETPSAQKWTVSPYSAQQGVLGYLEALGQSPVDMATQMQNMLPNNPNKGTQWSVKRQK